jgi:hypothetical protein
MTGSPVVGRAIDSVIRFKPTSRPGENGFVGTRAFKGATKLAAVASPAMVALANGRAGAHTRRMANAIVLTLLVAITVFLVVYAISVWRSPNR